MIFTVEKKYYRNSGMNTFLYYYNYNITNFFLSLTETKTCTVNSHLVFNCNVIEPDIQE